MWEHTGAIAVSSFSGGTETILNVPGAAWTEAHGVSGTTVVGYYYTDTYHSFEYNNGNYATFNAPFASHGTLASGISGSTIVGSYSDAAFGKSLHRQWRGLHYLERFRCQGNLCAGVTASLVGTYVGQDGRTMGPFTTVPAARRSMCRAAPLQKSSGIDRSP